MINRIANIKDAVHKILVEFPETRDDDRLLILKTWGTQDPNLKDVQFNTFAHFFLRGAFADPESIRRCRQLIQSSNPTLRGTTHYARRRAEMQMRDQVKLFK